MRNEVRRSDPESRVDNSGKANKDGNSADIHFIKPDYVREPASVRPRKTDHLRVGGRRTSDRPRCDFSENFRNLSPMKHKALLTFAWVTILSAQVAGILLVLALRKIGLL